MSYYGSKGDFYTGTTGYYRGDPGFFSSLWGGVKSLAGTYLNSVTGGAAGAISSQAGVGGSLFSRPVGQPTISGAASASSPGYQRGMATVGSRGRRGRLLTGAAMMPGMGSMAGAGMAQPALHPALAGGFRRRRRMNVTNPRALRRAIRRAHGFEKLARRVLGFSSPHKPKGRAYFKRRRRK